MKISKAYNVMSTLLQAGKPVMLRGTMGIGKSEMVESYAKNHKLKVYEMRLSQYSVVDLMGAFIIDGDSSRWARPSVFPGENEENCLLFLDEITSAQPDVQAAAYQLLLDRKVGPHKLHPKIQIVAAGNLESDQGVVNQIAAPLKNRMAHIQIDLDKDDWLNWAMGKEISEEIVAFIAYQGESKLYSYREDSQDDAFATPRSWSMADAAYKLAKNDRALALEVVQACVGSGIGIEFMAFADVRHQMPDLDKILAGEKVAPPTSLDVCWAVGVALSTRVTPDNFKNAHDYIASFKDYSREIGLFMVRYSVVRKPAIQRCPGYVECMKIYGEALRG